MAVSLNRSVLTHEKGLIKQGKAVRDDRDASSEHQPSTAQENEFVNWHGWREYGKWHMSFDATR